jgi:hypothetical protein
VSLRGVGGCEDLRVVQVPGADGAGAGWMIVVHGVNSVPKDVTRSPECE